MATPTNIFTAAELAAPLEVTPQAVRKQLRGVAPAGVKVVAGQRADAYALLTLPEALAQRLEQARMRGGFRSVGSMLSKELQRWVPAVPRKDIRDEDWSEAQRLQRALLPCLARLHDPIPAAEFEALGVESYRREFGHEVTPRHVRELLARTRQRDGGAEDWMRLEIYLPENLKPAPARPARESMAADLSALTQFVSFCANQTELSAGEWRGLWEIACEEHGRLVAEGWNEEAAARAVRDHLAELPCMAGTTRDALRMTFKRKLAAPDLRDKREDNGDPVILPQSDYDELIKMAGGRFRGQLAPALRELLAAGKLSEPARNRYGHCLHKRGYVPRHFTEMCGYKAWAYYMWRMDRFDHLMGRIERDWTSLPSLQVYSADDLTPCVYFYIEDGRGWYRLIRGQLLVLEDLSTGMIIDFALVPSEQYSSVDIRGLMVHAFLQFGVPAGLLLENGIWRRSTILKGRRGEDLSQAEVCRGLEDFGIRMIHTKPRHPWAKPIEKSFDLLQRLMQGEPGYCGRDERYDAPPELVRAKAAISRKTNPVHPRELGFHSFDEWKVRIGELCQQFNDTQQSGNRCQGMSPRQACESRLARSSDGAIIPASVLPHGLRHLLSHRERHLVEGSGIEFKSRGKKYAYRGEELGHLNGLTVLTGFDPQNPELLTVEDPKTGLIICVKRSQKTNPAECIFDPESRVLADESRAIAGQVAELRTYFKALDLGFELPKRAVVADALTLENARRVEQARQEIKAERQQAEHARRLGQRTGLLIDPADLNRLSAEQGDELADYLKGPKK